LFDLSIRRPQVRRQGRRQLISGPTHKETTMRFMMTIQSNAQVEAGALPDEKLLTAMGEYNQKLLAAGALLAGEGLHASAKGTRVRLAHDRFTVIDGPFAEASSMLAGFWLIQVKSRQEAIEWARRVPGDDGQIELRELFELSDFPADPSEIPGGWRDQEVRIREEAAATTAAAAPVARLPGTTRFILMLRSSRLTESDALPSAEVMEAMGALMGEGVKSGAFLGGEGLKPSKSGARVKRAGPTRTVVDGPFTEAKELIAGYVTLQTRTKAEAIEFARRWLQIHVRGLHEKEAEQVEEQEEEQEEEIDIRPLVELSDLPVDAQEKAGGWREREQRLRDSSS
jgi:hypothetical protein